ncbi:MAG: radical SAM protein [Patescibacteria group bacterium]
MGAEAPKFLDQSFNSQRERYSLILEQSHRIRNKEKLTDREHLARPYPGGDFDLLAINVPSTYQQGVIPDGEEPPWGMLRIVVTARERFGLKAGILDAHRLKLQPEEIKNQILKTKAKLVGINPTSVNVPEGVLIAEICDEIGIPYILGGIHATLNPSIARDDFPKAFAIVRGNGESVIGEVISVALNNSPRSIASGIYYHDQNVKGRLDYAKKLNPDEVPMVKQNEYIEEPVYSHTVQIRGKEKEIHEATLYVTDGCPFGCTFCASPVMVNRGKDKPYLRPRMKKIVDEVEHAVNDVGADAIHFLDDMAFIKGENIRDFYRGVAERNLMGKFIWRGLTRASVILREDFDDEVMEMMRESGAWKIALGIESGNNEVLKNIKKGITREQSLLAVKKLGLNRIQVKGFFIMGFPGETEEQIQETASFIAQLKDVGLTEIGVFQFKPYPGTSEYSQLINSRPEILGRLNYLMRKETGLTGKAQYRAEQKEAWLPDDLQIAEIPSGKVREYVLTSLKDFYGESINIQKGPSCI